MFGSHNSAIYGLSRQLYSMHEAWPLKLHMYHPVFVSWTYIQSALVASYSTEVLLACLQ